MKLVVAYTKEAENDLFEIAMYTLVEWGADQVEGYLALVREACEEILPRQHRLARSVPKRPDLRRWRCERHVIYFRVEKNTLEIIRILHDRMLPTRHL